MDDDNLHLRHLAAIQFALYLQRSGIKKVSNDRIESLYAQYLHQTDQIERFNISVVTAHLRAHKFWCQLRSKKRGNEIFFKPIIIGQNEIAFSVNKMLQEETEYILCLICSKGFSSQNSCYQHKESRCHDQMLDRCRTAMGETSDGKWQCPVHTCTFYGGDEGVMNFHLKHNEHQATTKCFHNFLYKPVVLKQIHQNTAKTSSSGYCGICEVTCYSKIGLDLHKQSHIHKLNAFRADYKRERTSLMNLHGTGLLIEPYLETTTGGDIGTAEKGLISVVTEKDQVETMFKVKNISSPDVQLVSVRHHDLEESEDVKINYQCVWIKPGCQCSVNMTRTCLPLGKTRIPIIFSLRTEDNEAIEIVNEIYIIRVNDRSLHKSINSIGPYVKVENRKCHEPEETVPGVKPKFLRDDELVLLYKLESYRPPYDIVQATSLDIADTVLEENHCLKMKALNFYTYTTHFSALLHLEELQMKIDIQTYTRENTTMRKDERGSKLLILEVPGLAEKRPSVLKGDKLIATCAEIPGKCFDGYVHEVQLRHVKLGFHKYLFDKHINGQKYCVRFTVNRLPIKLQHRAVTWSREEERDLEYTLFPDNVEDSSPPLATINALQFFNKDIESNPQQRQAIEQIVTGSSRPRPYLIFGPPGTGKTVTVVEAIKQVYTIFRNGAKILACAPQNNAADLLASRLLKHVDKKEIIRINAASRSINSIEFLEVQQISNYRDKDGGSSIAFTMHGQRSHQTSGKEVYFPSIEVLKKYSIIICTLVTAGRLASAGMDKHFTHIFIDEAGHATEPETTIALAGLLNVNQKNGGQLVLAGDPEQLGPIIRSPLAVKYKLGMSLLERLMSTQNTYKRNNCGEYDDKVVTKLLKSFRSHPSILEVPNHCFYDDELLVYADKVQRERFCQWKELPHRDFPVIFHGVNGEDKREEGSPSWFNVEEVDVVIGYIRQIMEIKAPSVRHQDIGIISPYVKQCKKIREALAKENKKPGRERHLDDIKVGSVEVFQGEERPIIIISTVRARDEFLGSDEKFALGFVGNPKRFNVALTRAKALLIVVGNPTLLCKDKNWRQFIIHCFTNGGYRGCPPPLEDEILDDERTEQKDAWQLKAETTKDHDLDDVSEIQQQVYPEWERRD